MNEYEEIEYLRKRLLDKDAEIKRLTEALADARRALNDILHGLQSLKGPPNEDVK